MTRNLEELLERLEELLIEQTQVVSTLRRELARDEGFDIEEITETVVETMTQETIENPPLRRVVLHQENIAPISHQVNHEGFYIGCPVRMLGRPRNPLHSRTGTIVSWIPVRYRDDGRRPQGMEIRYNIRTDNGYETQRIGRNLQNLSLPL